MKPIRLHILYLRLNSHSRSVCHHNEMSRTIAIVAKQCPWPNCVKKDLETELPISQCLSQGRTVARKFSIGVLCNFAGALGFCGGP